MFSSLLSFEVLKYIYIIPVPVIQSFLSCKSSILRILLFIVSGISSVHALFDLPLLLSDSFLSLMCFGHLPFCFLVIWRYRFNPSALFYLVLSLLLPCFGLIIRMYDGYHSNERNKKNLKSNLYCW